MTVKFLANMMNKEAEVILKDNETGKIYFKGTVAEVLKNNISDELVSWDFSDVNVIYL